MALKTWNFPLDGSTHTVTLSDDPFWGRRQVQIDGGPWQKLTTTRKSFSLDNEYPFPLGGHQAFFQTRRVGPSYRYECVVDGISVETGLRPLPPPPFPAWGWVFIVLCVLLLTGGALGGAAGACGALFCYGLARDDSQPMPIRVLICTGVTVACWIIYLVLATLFQFAFHLHHVQ